METVQIILSSGVGAGVMAIVLAILQRHWQKEDGKEGALAALVNAEKILLVDRVRHLAHHYIERRGITLEEKETIHELFAAYKGLGGNGHLDLVMEEIDRLPIISTYE